MFCCCMHSFSEALILWLFFVHGYIKCPGNVMIPRLWVPAGSPSHCGDVAVYVFDINQPGLPTPFCSVLVSVSVFIALSTVFHSINSTDNSPLSFCVLPVFLVVSTMCLFMKVFFSPDIFLFGWLGLKHQQLTNQALKWETVKAKNKLSVASAGVC